MGRYFINFLKIIPIESYFYGRDFVDFCRPLQTGKERGECVRDHKMRTAGGY